MLILVVGPAHGCDGGALRRLAGGGQTSRAGEGSQRVLADGNQLNLDVDESGTPISLHRPP